MPDVIIAGGGVAGAAVAIGLQRHGLEVVLAEAQSAPAWRIGETLAAEARPLLQDLGVWQDHLQAGHLPSYGNVSCWGWESPVEHDFTSNPLGHAWQLDRPAFERMMLGAATKAGARILHDSPITSLERKSGIWQVQAGAEQISAPLLIDATGRRAVIARQLGIRRQSRDKLAAVYAIAKSSAGTDQDSRTFIEALPDGWFYTALMPGGRRTLSFQTDADLLPPADQWRSPDWLREKLKAAPCLSRLFAAHDYQLADQPDLTSAHSGCMEQYAGTGWLAVGDAAISMDPITGHGLYKALLSASRAVQEVISGRRDDFSSYVAWCGELWAHFCHAHGTCYAQETRWPREPFWERRRAAS